MKYVGFIKSRLHTTVLKYFYLQLQEVISNGMQGNKYVSLLSWIMNTYNGSDLMMHSEINIDTSTIGPLLENSIVEDLQVQYLKVGLNLHTL